LKNVWKLLIVLNKLFILLYMSKLNLKMKKIPLLSISLIFLSLILFCFSCKKEDIDNVFPVVKILGENPMEILLNSEFDDPGAEYSDNIAIYSSRIDSDLDVNKIGSYEIDYIVLDEAGNETIATRIVDVIVDQSSFESDYNVSDTISSGPNKGIHNYSSIITPSASFKNKLLFSNFAGLGTSYVAIVEFNKVGGLTIPQQLLSENQDSLSGNGMLAKDGKSIHLDFSITYKDGSGTDVGKATYLKIDMLEF